MTQSNALGPRVTPPPLVPAAQDPPLKDVLVELWKNMEKLLRQEIALASAELDLKAQRLKTEVTSAAIGAGLLLAGALALVAALILLLDLFLPAWLAALLTGTISAAGGLALVKTKKPTARDLVPERTIQSLGKDLKTFTESTK